MDAQAGSAEPGRASGMVGWGVESGPYKLRLTASGWAARGLGTLARPDAP